MSDDGAQTSLHPEDENEHSIRRSKRRRKSPEMFSYSEKGKAISVSTAS
jgi:hypothetical protein